MENWGALLFVAAGLFSIQKAVRRNAARNWGWGRTGDAGPLSRPSYALAGTMLIIIGATIAQGPRVSPLMILLFFACFAALGIAGFIDTRRDKRRRSSR